MRRRPRPDWAFRKAAPAEVDAMIARLDRGLADGALGIGMGPAYTPAAGRDELLRVFELAARRKALAFIHMRSAGEVEPGGSIDALQEVLANVAATGASVHIVHIGSMGLRQTPRLLSDDRRRARTRPRHHDRGLSLYRGFHLPAVRDVRAGLAGAACDWFQGRPVGRDRRAAHRGELRALPQAGRPRRDSHDPRGVGARRARAPGRVRRQRRRAADQRRRPSPRRRHLRAHTGPLRP